MEYFPAREVGTEEERLARASALRDEFAYQAHQPPGGDPLIGHLFSVVNKRISEDRDFERLVYEFAQVRKVAVPLTKSHDLADTSTTPVSESAGLFRIAIQADADNFDNGYPYSWLDADFLHDSISSLPEILKEDRPRSDSLTTNFFIVDANTTIFTRQILPTNVIQATAPDRFPDEEVLCWDIGAGAALGTTLAFLKDENGFTEIFEDITTEDPDITRKLKLLGQLPSRIGRYVAIDPAYIDSEINVTNAARSALRPFQERMSPHTMADFETLAHRAHVIPRAAYDLSKPDHLAAFDDEYPERPHYVTIITSGHLMKRKKVFEQVIEAVEQRIHPRGVIMVFDFMYTRPNSNKTLHAYRHWHHPGRYRLHALDMAQRDRGWQLLAMAPESRARRNIQFGLGQLAFRGASETLPVIISKAAPTRLHRQANTVKSTPVRITY